MSGSVRLRGDLNQMQPSVHLEKPVAIQIPDESLVRLHAVAYITFILFVLI